MDDLGAKLLSMGILTFVSGIICLIPWKFRKQILRENLEEESRNWKGTLLSVLLCFGGGVLLATSLIHLLPEVREGIVNSEVLPHEYEEFPMAEVILCLGFFLIYFIEEIVHSWCDSPLHSGSGHDHPECIHTTFTVRNQHCADRDRAIDPSGDSHGITNPNYETFKSMDPSGVPQTTSTSNIGPNESQTPSTGGHSVHRIGQFIRIRDFLTVLALSTHAIFEGLAIGLEDEVHDVWTLFGAIASHKFVISFCVGMQLIVANTCFKAYIMYISMWVFTTPIGIAIGTWVSQVANGSPGYTFSVSLLQGLAAGTLVYVVVFEVLQREKSKNVSGILQLLFVVLGFSILMSVQLLSGGHSHSHGGHDHDHDHDDHDDEDHDHDDGDHDHDHDLKYMITKSLLKGVMKA